MARPPIQRVDIEIRRDLFNTHVLPLIERGELLETVLSEGPPNPRHHQTPGTRSQRVAYTDRAGVKIAICHQYKRPDGRLGASGKPDPKLVLHDGALYALPVPVPAPGRKKRRG